MNQNRISIQGLYSRRLANRKGEVRMARSRGRYDVVLSFLSFLSSLASEGGRAGRRATVVGCFVVVASSMLLMLGCSQGLEAPKPPAAIPPPRELVLELSLKTTALIHELSFWPSETRTRMEPILLKRWANFSGHKEVSDGYLYLINPRHLTLSPAALSDLRDKVLQAVDPAKLSGLEALIMVLLINKMNTEEYQLAAEISLQPNKERLDAVPKLKDKWGKHLADADRQKQISEVLRRYLKERKQAVSQIRHTTLVDLADVAVAKLDLDAIPDTALATTMESIAEAENRENRALIELKTVPLNQRVARLPSLRAKWASLSDADAKLEFQRVLTNRRSLSEKKNRAVRGFADLLLIQTKDIGSLSARDLSFLARNLRRRDLCDAALSARNLP